MRRWPLLLALLLVPLTIAQPGGDPEDYEDFQGGPGSGCTYEISGGGSKSLAYEAGCFSGDGQAGSAQFIEIVFDVGDETEFLVEGGQFSGNQQGGSAMGFEFIVEFLQIVEFRDVDGDGAYDPETDEAVSVDGLREDGWGNIRSSRPEGGGVAFEADYNLQNGGTFSIHGQAKGSTYSAGGVSVKPLDTKLDFIFEGYGYQQDDTQLAVVLHVQSEGGSASGSGGSFGSGGAVVQGRESGLVGSAGSSHIYFTWADTADVDGTARPVHDHIQIIDSESGQFEGEGGSYSGYEAEAGVTLAYARGDSIVHDPRLGVQFNVSNSSPGLPVVGLVAALAALAVMRRR